MDVPASSLEGLQTARHDRALTWVRRGILTLLLALVVAGATGYLGVREGTSSASEAGWSLRVTYAQVARAGLDVPWTVTVRHPGGFHGPIRLAVTGSYFDIFETQGFHPDPSASTRDGDTLFLTFDPPPSGDTFVVAYDAYIQPASQMGASGRVSIADGPLRLAPVDFRTVLLP